MAAELFSSLVEKWFAKRILASVVLIQFFLFGITIHADCRSLGSPGRWSHPQVNGSVIGILDSHGYYAWLRSPLIDGDWDFTNEYQFYQASHPAETLLATRTRTGRPPNHWSIGPALVWSVAVIPVHEILPGGGEEPRGFAAPYNLAIGTVTFALSLATLLFLYKIARMFAPPVPAAAAAAVALLGTPIIAYGTVSVGMAHGPASAALAGYVWVWLYTFGSTRPGRWFIVGLLLGIVCLMRWQLATFAILPALEMVWLVRRDWKRSGRFLALATLAASGSVIGFVPQMVAWSVVYGRPLLNPHYTKPDWTAPEFWRVLASGDRSLFYWTPAALFGVIGLFVASRPQRSGSAQSRILLAAVAIQIYMIAVALTDRSIHLGYAFGFRFLTETCVVLGVGLAVLLRKAAPRWPVLLASVCGAAVSWNLLLVGVYNRCVSGVEDGPAALVGGVGRYIVRRPFDASLFTALAMVLAFRFWRGFLSCTDASETPVVPVGRWGLAGVMGQLVSRCRRMFTH